MFVRVPFVEINFTRGIIMRIKCYYNKNLKMSPEKLAAQVGHVIFQATNHYKVCKSFEDNIIVVLKASTTKFNLLQEELRDQGHTLFVQKDLGLTEVESGTETVFGYVEVL